MMTDSHPGFKSLVDNLSTSGDGYAAQIPESWRQGRTAYGGVSTALCAAAAELKFSDLPPLRSFQMGFIGPIGENAVFTPTLLRQGRNVTVIGVDIVCDGKLCGRNSLFYGASRESVLTETLKAPEASTPEDTELFTPEAFRDFVPAFFLRFDTRLIAGHRPMSGAKDGYIRTWSRHEDPASRDGLLPFLAIGDVLPPAAVPKFSSFGPISSMNWQLNILTPKIETRDGWWHIETKLSAAQDGYSTQIMRFWNTDGTLIAEGTQSVTIFM